MTTLHEFECRDLPLQKAVVYNDRAELTRVIKVQLHKGINEVHVKNMSQKMINDSYRVSGRGVPATIHEVMYQNKPTQSSEIDPPKVQELKKKLEEDEADLAKLGAKKAAVERSIRALDTLMDTAGNGVIHGKDGQERFVADEQTFKSIKDLHDFYRNQSELARIELHNLEVALKKQNEIVNKTKRQIFDTLNTYRMSLIMRNIVIVLETKEGGAIELDFIYQVLDASWRPSYDIRVNTSPKLSMQISYFGHILQRTGEDWKDVSLVLTTLKPALSDGSVPSLKPIEVHFKSHGILKYSDSVQYRVNSATNIRQQRLEMAQVPRSMNSSEDMGFGLYDEEVETEAFKAEVTQSTLSSEFCIAKRSEIPSDGTEHKVSIGVVETEPKLLHECVPSLNTSVYLTASAINSSNMPFLAGEASVYLDSSFIAKSQLRDVSSSERFTCALGVDTLVRVEYKAAKKFTEEQGFVSKTKNTVNDQPIIIKNTRKNPITIILREQIPRSSDEKIKISLLEPSAKGESGEQTKETQNMPDVGARLSVHNTLSWTINMKGAEQKELHIKWQLEYPKNQAVEFVQRF